jgi:hypothetical protein
MRDLQFVDLSLMDGEVKVFDGLASGEFIDMLGRETIVKPEELPVYVANTKAALESTRDASGQIVGFPIDQMNHEFGMASGWIVDVNMADGRNVVEFTPRWNQWGKEKIGADELRFFSATFDIEKKVIMGGSLTNWPASRTPEHQILLRPVQLSTQLTAIASAPIVTLADMLRDGVEQIKELVTGLRKSPVEIQPKTIGEVTMPEPVTVDLAAYLQSPEAVNLINQRAEEIAAVTLAKREHESKVAALSARLVGGNTANPKGLPVAHDALSAFLSKLTPELFGEAEAILTSVIDKGVIQFSESGTSAVVSGGAPLPDEIKPLLRKWIDQGLSVDEFFQANAVELGAMSDYNLTEFSKEK